MSDHALEDYQQLEIALKEYLDSRPEVERKDVSGAFTAAWHARVRAARQTMNSYSSDSHEAMVSYIIKKMEDHIKYLHSKLFGYWRFDNTQKKLLESYRVSLEEKGINPEDAPAWRRISEQRKEIRRLIKENYVLKGMLAERDSST